MKCTVSGILLLAVLAATSARAEPLSYDYAYLSHRRSQVDGQNFGNDTIGGYMEIGRRFHLLASYGNAGAYGNPAWKDSRATRFGVGGHLLFGEDTMIALEAVAVRARFESPVLGTVSDTGMSAIFEIRHRLAPWVELIGSASHSDVLGRQTSEFVAGPVFHVNPTIAIGAFYRRMEQSSGFELTARTYY